MTEEVAMRAKLRVTNVHEHEDMATKTPTSTEVTFAAVSKNGGYPEDGSDENNTFAKFTPQADLKMVIQNPELMGAFEIGQEFFVDFTPVPV